MSQRILRRDPLIGVEHETLVKEVGEVLDHYMTDSLVYPPFAFSDGPALRITISRMSSVGFVYTCSFTIGDFVTGS